MDIEPLSIASAGVHTRMHVYACMNKYTHTGTNHTPALMCVCTNVLRAPPLARRLYRVALVSRFD